jgi:alpha-L-rhamnosidase
LKRTRLCNLLLTTSSLVAAAYAAPVHLRCEYRENPLGIDEARPHLSWQSDNSERNWKQSAYEVLVASSGERLQPGQADVWDSGKIQSDQSVGIAYPGPPLQSRKRYYWKVRVWDAVGQVFDSVEGAWWEMGLLHPEDWKAKWITWKNPDEEADRAAIRWIWAPGGDVLATPPETKVQFQATLDISRKPENAALFIAVHGAYQAKVNGREVGSKSRWDGFDRRDISSELVVGKNLIEVEVTSPPAPESGPAEDSKSVAGFASLLKLANPGGTSFRFASGPDWKARVENGSKWQPAQIVGDLADMRFGDPGPLPQPAAYFRQTKNITRPVRRARLYVTALGSYRLFLNGRRVGNDVLTPGFTDYRKRVLYQTYDVTGEVVRGTNVIGALVGDGWYASPLTWNGAYFFKPPDRLFVQLELEYGDGSEDTVVTDGSWKASSSPILESQIYSGEFYDARLENPGWNKSNFDDSIWKPAAVADPPPVLVTSQIDSPPQVISRIPPKTVKPSANGAFIYDMGQNMVGWVALKVKGPAGTKVRLRFAEILNPDGTIYTENLRNADATDTYILNGGGEESYAPNFTFHGFRYVEMTGYPGRPSLDTIQGEVVSSVGGEPTATLKTSSDLTNRMWEIGLWGQRGNFLSIPTDCPQRDERLGWMGDAGVFWRTGTYNFDVAAFSQKFIQDIVDAQSSEGAFTNVSPNTLPVGGGGAQTNWAWNEDLVGAPGWGDAGVIIPWTTWLQYGDRAVIEKNWDAMQHWMEFIGTRNPDFIRKNGVGPNFADWLAPDSNTNRDLLATAYWALIAHMMSQMAQAVGKQAEANQYDDLVQNIRSAFQKAYIQADGTVGTGTQTSYVVALYTQMAPPALTSQLVDRLVKDIEARNWHLSTGFLGTPFLLFTLADHGRTDVAYRLLLNETYPSWGYMLSQGATTWWERWNGDTGDPSMNSYNHYAFGSVVAWVYRYAAGIDATIDAPGFKQIVVHPHLDSRMKSARAEYESVYGRIVSDWSGAPTGPFSLRVRIPANTSAKIFLPAIAGAHVTEGGHPIAAEAEGESLVVQVGSGSYNFLVE